MNQNGNLVNRITRAQVIFDPSLPILIRCAQSLRMSRKPVVLVIRDGWGENHDASLDPYNAVKQAHTPCADMLTAEWPRTELMACGPDVGLPEGVMGNSEVGHQNIGAGRIVEQELARLNRNFRENLVKDNPVLQGAFQQVKAQGSKLHLFGLVSDAGVHSMLEHLYGFLRIAKECAVEQVYVHAFTDGRDTPPTSGMGYIEELEGKMQAYGVGQIATVSGRFWAMDRDLRWDRVEKAYDCLTGRNIERTATSAREAVQGYYDNPLSDSQKGDEFILPTAITGADGKPLALVEDGDAVIFFNFRGDRPRELTRAFIEDGFEGFDRGSKLDLYYAILTNYQKGLCDKIIFDKPPKMPDILGEVVSKNSIPQFRTAETEKFPHVTFFFNDYREEPFEGEDRELIPSNKEVSTYDQAPEMSAYGIKDAAVKAIRSGHYGLVVINFANPDMVGHTGNQAAATKACEVVDACLQEVLDAVDAMGGRAVITADHGNSDQMFVPTTESAHTAHTLNPVEIVLYGEGVQALKLKDGGRLADIAPTVLKLMDIEIPAAMTGECLVV